MKFLLKIFYPALGIHSFSNHLNDLRSWRVTCSPVLLIILLWFCYHPFNRSTDLKTGEIHSHYCFYSNGIMQWTHILDAHRNPFTVELLHNIICFACKFLYHFGGWFRLITGVICCTSFSRCSCQSLFYMEGFYNSLLHFSPPKLWHLCGKLFTYLSLNIFLSILYILGFEQGKEGSHVLCMPSSRPWCVYQRGPSIIHWVNSTDNFCFY